MIERKTSFNHSGRVQTKSHQQQQVIDPVVLAKALPPQENRINHAQPIDGDGQQKEVPVSEPIHHDRVIWSCSRAKRNLAGNEKAAAATALISSSQGRLR